jgi:hypothetical protein
MRWVDEQIEKLPADLPDWMRPQRINHIYTYALLGFCGHLGVPSLGELLYNQKGRLFCSTETLAPTKDLYKGKLRAISRWIPNGDYEFKAEFHYSPVHISSDTIRGELAKGGPLSIIAELSRVEEKVLIFGPLIMGNPWLEEAEVKPSFDIMWYSHEYNQNFPEDIDEFSRVTNESVPPSPEPMRSISERAFKTVLAELLGDSTAKDWGGETSDYFAAHLHLQKRPITAAFLLKGPARFAPMTLNHLGKNNDQIVRLAKEPAEMLIVQHSHDITPPGAGHVKGIRRSAL